jgi:hypothetical protein
MLRQQVVENYRDWPDLKKMFDPEKKDNSFKTQITAYPDSIFIWQVVPFYKQRAPNEPPVVESTYPLSEPIFAQFLKSPLLDQFSQEAEGKYNPYSDFGAFMQGEQAKVDALSATNPFYKLGFEILREDAQYLPNWQVVIAVSGLPLDSKYFDRYLENVVYTYVNTALTQAWANRDPRLLALLTPEQQDIVGSEYQKLDRAVSAELFARVGKWVFSENGEDAIIRTYYNHLWGDQEP